MTLRHFIFIQIYSSVIILIVAVVHLLSFVFPQIKRQLPGRPLKINSFSYLRIKRNKHEQCILFFCSSAGEYEQAKPIIDRLLKHSNVFIHIIFFSVSGYLYAQARHETASYSLSPPDTYWHWNNFFKALRPDLTVIVHHEIWPAFLAVALDNNRLMLIDATFKMDAFLPKKLFLNTLMRAFDEIHVVSEQDKYFFETVFHLKNVYQSGNTKFDRIKERTAALQPEIYKWQQWFDQSFKEQQRFIIGSAWSADCEVVFKAYAIMKKRSKYKWQLIICPHQVDNKTVQWIIAECQKKGFQYVLLSQLMVQDKPTEKLSETILIIDKLGILAELYPCCQLGVVGGAFHYQVHNVLEPTFHGVSIAFGPFCENSQEAVYLSDLGLARMVGNSKKLLKWWREEEQCLGEKKPQLKRFIDEHCGGAEFITNRIKNLMNLGQQI